MLTVIKHFFTDEAGNMIGKPLGVTRAIAGMETPQPESYETHAHASSVMPWHLWTQQHVEEGVMWRLTVDQYRGTTRQHIIPLSNLCRVEHSIREVDIRSIRAATASKSDLTAYRHLKDLATGEGKDILAEHPEGPGSIAEFMGHPQVRLGLDGSTDTVSEYRWDGAQGLVLSNDGGSHHLAAAIHLAHQFVLPHHVMARYALYELNTLQAQKLQQQTGLVYLPEDPSDCMAIEQAIERFGADYGVLTLRGWPEKRETQMLALPLRNRRSLAVYNVFRERGWATLNDQLQAAITQSERNNTARRAA